MAVDWQLVLDGLSEDASPAQRVRFTRWLATDTAHGRLLDAAFMAADRVLLSAEPDRGERTGEQRVTPRVSRSVLRPAWVAGVGVALACAIAIGVLKLAARLHSAHTDSAVTQREIATRPGETADVRLPDGTRVILGAASVLRYAVADSGHAREVVLAGEGYFEVVHDAARPFRVQVGTTTAEDIGTAFDLRSYAGDPGVRLIVSNGAVSIRANSTHSPTVLQRGSLALVGATGEVHVTTGIEVDRYLAWTRGQLVFTDEPLGMAVADIGRRFDIVIRLADPALAERRLTASFADDPVTEVVRALESAMDVRAVREGQTITLYPQ